MTDLTEFLNARLSEDERAADEVHLARTCDCIDRDGDFHMFPGEACGCEYPARVLREVEAKRRIVNSLQTAARADTYGQPNEFLDGYTTSLDIAVRALAAVYRDHPDYDPAWA